MTMAEKLGKYEVRRELGRGAMGVVYEGFDPTIERRVALKTIKGEHLDQVEAGEILSRFKREAQAAGRLTHANIVGIYEFGEDNGTVFIAMEFVEGRELKDYFDTEQRFPIADIRRIMGELLDALDYSHRQGVVHRDIKPANIIILANGTVKVADFGIARLESSTLTQQGSVLGTPSYMSPEQFMGQTVDGRSDIFSAGVVLYQFLTGERPFTGAFTTIMHKVLKENPPLPSELNVQVPLMFDAVVRKAIAKRPEDRYQTAREFRDAIMAAGTAGSSDATVVNTRLSQTTLVNPGFADAQAGFKIAPVPPAPPAPPVPPGLPGVSAGAGKPSNNAMIIGAAVIVLLVVLGIGYVVFNRNAGQPGAQGASVASNGPAPQALPAAPAAAPVAASLPPPPALPSDNGTAVISALGIADPSDQRYASNPEALHNAVLEDARRQLVEKAAALYVEQNSLDRNYAVVRDKLLARNGEFIKAVLEEQQPVVGQDGLMSATLRATVNLRAVQKSLNQMSTDERIEFIRKNGDPKIAVHIASRSADSAPDGPATPSPIAENLLAERIRSFGFRVISDDTAPKQADFGIDGEVRFKKLSTRLAASGLEIDKYVLTSWTVKAVDRQSGEDIYYNTKIPEKQAWNSEEQALADVGRLVGDEFNKAFFLEYFHYPTQQVRLELSGLPPRVGDALLTEINGLSSVLSATQVPQSGGATVIDTTLSSAAGSPSDAVQAVILVPLNRKLGKNCLSVSNVSAASVHLSFDAACADAATLARLETLPPAGLIEAAPIRRDEVVKNPDVLKRMTI